MSIGEETPVPQLTAEVRRQVEEDWRAIKTYAEFRLASPRAFSGETTEILQVPWHSEDFEHDFLLQRVQPEGPTYYVLYIDNDPLENKSDQMSRYTFNLLTGDIEGSGPDTEVASLYQHHQQQAWYRKKILQHLSDGLDPELLKTFDPRSESGKEFDNIVASHLTKLGEDPVLVNIYRKAGQRGLNSKSRQIINKALAHTRVEYPGYTDSEREQIQNASQAIARSKDGDG